MNILAIESSTQAAGAALLFNDQWSSYDCPLAQTASLTLLPGIRQMMSTVNCSFKQLDAIAFAAGPGAFTGVRLACSMAQAFAEAHHLPVVAVGSLAAMAVSVIEQIQGVEHVSQFDQTVPISIKQSQATESFQQIRPSLDKLRIRCLLDAHMGEIYAADFDSNGIITQQQVVLAKPDDLLAECAQYFAQPPHIICGNALKNYPRLYELINQFYHNNSTIQKDLNANQEYCPDRMEYFPDILPTAKAVGTLAAQYMADGGGCDPAAASPIYVRHKVAQTIAERLAIGGKA